MNRIVLILNPKAGNYLSRSTTGRILERALRSRFPDLVVWRLERSTAASVLAAIGRDQSIERIFAAGGDGTISAVANAMAWGRASLGVIPLGTMNLTARSLGLPQDPLQAVHALLEGEDATIDLGRIEDRYFIHHVSIGIHPTLIRIRDRLDTGSRYKKMWATIRSLPVVLSAPRVLTCRIADDSGDRQEKTPAIVLSNNLFGAGHMPYADELAMGTLGLYVSKPGNWKSLAGAAAAVLIGRTLDSESVSVSAVSRAELDFSTSSNGTIRAAVDGELVRLPSRVIVSAQPGALRVIKPGLTAA